MGAFEPDVGVLVVHGIGTQSEGAELRQWVDAVVGYLDAFPGATDGRPGAAVLEPNPDDPFVRVRTPPFDPANDATSQSWLVGEAFWADAFDVPNRKQFTAWLVGVASWFLYLFVVRLWRRFFVDRVHLLTGLAFAASVGWLVSDATSGDVTSTSWTWLIVGTGLLAVTLARKGRQLGGVVVAATLLVGYPLAGLLVVAVVALWVVGLLPGKISEKARATQLNLSQSVGDVYALISSRRREQAMFDAISASAKKLTSALDTTGEPKPVVIVAHSQGAALTYRALNRDDGLRDALAGRRVTVITYGAGIVPIHLLEHRLRASKRGWRLLHGAAGLLALLLLAFGLARIASDGVDTLTRWVIGASAALVAGTFAATWRQERRARCEPETVQVRRRSKKGIEPREHHDGVCVELMSPDARQLRWVDLWAPWDPVPNGPLSVSEPCRPSPCSPDALAPPAQTDEFVSCRVSNLHQPWRDHVVYRDNPEDVVSRWVGEIATRAVPGLPPGAVERPRLPTATAAAAREWRRRRGRALLLGQVAGLVLGIVAVVRQWDRLDDLGRRAARRLPLRSAVSGVTDAVPEGFRDVVWGEHRDPSHLQGLLVAAAAVVLTIALASIVVSWWQRTATGRYLAGHEDAALRVDLGRAAAVAAGAAAGVLLLWAAFWYDIEEVPTRLVRVHPASLTGAAVTGRTEVRFEPLGTSDDSPVVVEVGDAADTVELDRGVEYRVTATAVAAEGCSVSIEREKPEITEVRVRCAVEGERLPKVAGRDGE